MHPILFNIPVPEFLQGFLPATITIYSYGFFIAIGAISGIVYTARQAKQRFQVKFDDINILFLLIIVAAFVGGKAFLFFESPSYYSDNPGKLFSGRGFVFYGSLTFVIPVMLIFFKKYKLPVYQMLDIMAITACIVHMFGRIGCFMAGCCYGVPWKGPLSVMFNDPHCLAKPLHTHLHPTQLYSASMIFVIFVILMVLKRYQKFDGQLFLTYLMLYAVGRSIVEIFRGDVTRGYIIEGLLSHAQFVSIFFIASALYFYRKLSRKSKLLGKQKR
ncbi:MAG: prolipoprotein diacylglyceryl transferase [Bacteroidota bacterium]